MQNNARLEDVILTLNHDPESFLRGILGSFYRPGVLRNKAVVRLGISGTGRQPHYCIEQGPRETVFSYANGIEVQGFEFRAIFNGRSHKPILEDEFKGTNWSSSSASYAEIQSLLGLLLSSKKRH